MEARDQHKTGNKCTTRRGCAGGRGRLHTNKHGAIVLEGRVGNRGLKKSFGTVWSCRVHDSVLDTSLGFCWR